MSEAGMFVPERKFGIGFAQWVVCEIRELLF